VFVSLHFSLLVIFISSSLFVNWLQVIALTDEHTCISSGMKKTTILTSSWVASLALPTLTKKSQMGAKELQTTLKDTHNCHIAYETMWKGREKALAQLYGAWEDSFKLLFRWREAIMEKMPDSIIEIELATKDDGKLYF
jgi:hypothetical protein